jgi:hypothetical protein
MNEHTVAMRRGLPAIGKSWQGFWFGPQPMYTLGLVRIAFGALAVLWTLWLFPLLYEMFGTNGIAPQRPSYAYTWGVFDLWSSNPAVLLGWALLLAASIALMVGWHSRFAAIVVFVLILSFQRRDPWFFNAGDAVVRIEALFLALSPCGAALSLDQRRRTGSFWSAQTLPNWPIRLIQVQMSIIYVASVQTKLAGQTWLDGTAVSYALRLQDMQRIPVPDWLTTNASLMNAATWATVLVELALGVLVWNKRCRPWVLAAGVLLHLGIDLNIEIGIFSYAMLVLYVAWIAPATAQQLPTTIKHATTQLRTRLHRSPQAPPPPPTPPPTPDQLVHA